MWSVIHGVMYVGTCAVLGFCIFWGGYVRGCMATVRHIHAEGGLKESWMDDVRKRSI